MRIAKSKKRSNRISLFYDISKTLSQKNFINFIQKNFMEKQAGNFTNTHQL